MSLTAVVWKNVKSLDGAAALHLVRDKAANLLNWWIDGLCECVDERTGRQHQQWTTLLLTSAEGLKIYVRKADRIRRVERVSPVKAAHANLPSGLPSWGAAAQREITVLRLSEDQVLQHEMRIPKGARDVMDPIIRNQLERIVPWAPSDLRYGFVVADEDADGDHLEVAAIATSAKILDRANAQAKALDIAPDYMDFAKTVEAPNGIRLVGATHATRAGTDRQVRLGLAIAFSIAAVIAAVGLGRMTLLSSELGALRATLFQTRSTVSEATRLFAENEAMAQQRDWIFEKREREPAVVVVLEELSKALPDDAYLERLEIRGRNAELHGVSVDAASLIRRLETSGQFSQVSFSAPTTRRSDGETETFAVSARLESGTYAGASK